MLSPFPGMDPYLEGYLWPDVHSALANKIRQHLTPYLIPRYVARLEIAVIQDDDALGTEVKIMYPDVEVLKTSSPFSPFEVSRLRRELSRTLAPRHLGTRIK